EREKRFREIDTDDAALRPARRHRTRQAAGAAAHVEQRSVGRECCKIKKLLRQPPRAAAEEHLIGGAIGRLVDICPRRHGRSAALTFTTTVASARDLKKVTALKPHGPKALIRPSL